MASSMSQSSSFPGRPSPPSRCARFPNLLQNVGASTHCTIVPTAYCKHTPEEPVAPLLIRRDWPPFSGRAARARSRRLPFFGPELVSRYGQHACAGQGHVPHLRFNREQAHRRYVPLSSPLPLFNAAEAAASSQLWLHSWQAPSRTSGERRSLTPRLHPRAVNGRYVPGSGFVSTSVCLPALPSKLGV